LRHGLRYIRAPRRQPPLVETSDKLGAMTSELECNEIICAVVCAGPKNYEYRTVSTVAAECKTVCKVRGITLNYSSPQLVNFAKRKDMILSRDVDETVTVRTKNKIKCNRCVGEVNIISQREENTYKISFSKRRSLNGNTSSPFGCIYNARMMPEDIHG
jgi:hypothetical protein